VRRGTRAETTPGSSVRVSCLAARPEAAHPTCPKSRWRPHETQRLPRRPAPRQSLRVADRAVLSSTPGVVVPQLCAHALTGDGSEVAEKFPRKSTLPGSDMTGAPTTEKHAGERGLNAWETRTTLAPPPSRGQPRTTRPLMSTKPLSKLVSHTFIYPPPARPVRERDRRRRPPFVPGGRDQNRALRHAVGDTHFQRPASTPGATGRWCEGKVASAPRG
jgi:hypothetical protein